MTKKLSDQGGLESGFSDSNFIQNAFGYIYLWSRDAEKSYSCYRFDNFLDIPAASRCKTRNDDTECHFDCRTKKRGEKSVNRLDSQSFLCSTKAYTSRALLIQNTSRTVPYSTTECSENLVVINRCNM